MNKKDENSRRKFEERDCEKWIGRKRERLGKGEGEKKSVQEGIKGGRIEEGKKRRKGTEK